MILYCSLALNACNINNVYYSTTDSKRNKYNSHRKYSANIMLCFGILES